MNGIPKRCGIVFGTLLLAGCGTQEVSIVQVQDLSFSIPTTLQSISPQTLDNEQVAHTIIGARKDTTSSLVMSESSLPNSITIKEFTEQSSKRIEQQMVWYVKGSISSQTFTCKEEKITWYTHSFTENDIKDSAKVLTYYNQFSFQRNGSVYIISLAQKEEKSIFSDIIASLWCK